MFVQCRGCSQTVPGSMSHCQFCGASLAGVAPAAPKASVWHDDSNYTQAYRRPTWVPLAYNLVSGYIGISGAIQAVTGGIRMAKGETLAVIGVIFGIIGVILGIGLLLKIEFIRGVVNFVCGISLIFGVIELFSSFGVLLFGAFGVLYVLHNILDIVSNVAMIYLVGETD